MKGAIIGDVVGSYIEILEYQKKRSYQDRMESLNFNTPLITEDCSVTDDSILTVAIVEALLSDRNYDKYLRLYGQRELNIGLDKYGRSRFGDGFIKWLSNESLGDSYGNGGAMRVSPIGLYFNTIDEIKYESTRATIPSHCNKDAINGAVAAASTIFLLKQGKSKEEVLEYIESKHYSLNYSLDDLQRNNTFSSKAIDSVPIALFCFLQSNSFENAIRIALSVGGDSDTICSIVGALSETYYGLDENLYEQVKSLIPDYMLKVINTFYQNKVLTNSKK